MDDFVLEEKYRRWNSFSESPEDLSEQPNQKFKPFYRESNFSFPNLIIDKAFYEKELETITDSITHFPLHNMIISKKTFLPPLRILPKGIQLVSAKVCYGSDIHKTEKASPLKTTIACETSATTINIAPTFLNHLTINPTRIALVRNETYKKIQYQIGNESKAEKKIILNSFQKLNKDAKESNLVNEMASMKKALHVTESVLFCRSSQTQLQCMNHVVIGLCDDCFMKTQKTVGEKIRTRTPLMTPETNDSFTSLYMEPLFYANDDKHFKSEEFIRSDDEEIDHSSLKRLKFEDLTLYCEAVNDHLLNLKQVDADLVLGHSPLMICSISQPQNDHDWNVVQNAMNLGNVNDASKSSKQTPLMSAASKGYVKMVRLLLEAGADPNQQDDDGSTALMYAAVQGHEACVCLLLEHPKCNPRIKDNDFGGDFSHFKYLKVSCRNINVSTLFVPSKNK
ncbi:KN motif and ankyrin repeat domain-containing protein 1 [Trichonephila inaurata madagascariensis]|uniref:KN motif and ankyrin repeat domain-containing protein 1 n=1 Tax=Trichonephila inaurata madagascariensis TaxID=2747483 RepID=A0A8X6WSC6_9ARAC|nr:KN motif and ankyrin repeat domain-containing protein 1 [Trichonephila inaurata madagascariensis]